MLLITTDETSIGLPVPLQTSPSLIEAVRTFLRAELRSPHTRRAYRLAAREFFLYLFDTLGLGRLDEATPLHVASWIETMENRGLSKPTIKQRLAAVTMLLRSLVRQRVIASNPADMVKGPSYSLERGKTPVLDAAEMGRLLCAIDATTLIGKRDRALIATMAYTFARISAVTSLKVADLFTQKRRLWIRLSEKGGKCKDMPCHHNLEHYLLDWLDVSGLVAKPEAFLFPTFASGGARQTGRHTSGETLQAAHNKVVRPLSSRPMNQAMTWQMLQRRAKSAGIGTDICNHTFRATGITAYLSNGGTIERAKAMAGHKATTTTQLYDRRPDDVTLEEIERIHYPT